VQGRHVRQALQILDNHNMTLRAPGMRRKRQENYIVPEPDWLWCLDGHDKLVRYGIEIYGSVDAYSRKIVWFYVGVSNRTQVSYYTNIFILSRLSATYPRQLQQPLPQCLQPFKGPTSSFEMPFWCQHFSGANGQGQLASRTSWRATFEHFLL
jgi:hypothetical protein